MKKKKRWSDRTRLMLILEFAVVLPAAALVILGVWHLKSIQRQRSVEAAIQRDFMQVLKISEKHINMKAYDLLDDARSAFPAPSRACNVDMDRILSSRPYIAHVWTYEPRGGLIFRSQPRRLQEASFQSERDYWVKMLDGWMKVEYEGMVQHLSGMERKGSRYMGEANWVERGDKKLYQAGETFVMSNPQGGKVVGGIIFDAEYLRDQFFPEAVNVIMAKSAGDDQRDIGETVVMIHPRSDNTPLVASADWDGGMPEVERNMESLFPGLTLAIKLRGTTVEALGQRFIRTSSFVLGAISLLMVVGIVLTYRTISREMALAKLKSDFVSNVSHELRTPLSLIRLYAETLEMGRVTNPEKYQEYYKIIRKESERLSGLINNILDFSRIEAGRKEYDFRETDIGELVHTTIDSYRFQIEQHGFTFEERIADNLPKVRVDREAIARSLLNLVNNALKYSQDRKYIGVNLYRQNGSVKLEVIDHGIGIASNEQHKIFEKFYRVGDPLVHNTKGSGLGLALVKHIVKAHGGDVAVESTPGEGSIFTITLPAEQVKAVQEHEAKVTTA